MKVPTTVKQHIATSTMGLCGVCSLFDIQSFATSPGGVRGYSVAAIRIAAEAGCEFCSLLKSELLVNPRLDEGNDWLHFQLGKAFATGAADGSQSSAGGPAGGPAGGLNVDRLFATRGPLVGWERDGVGTLHVEFKLCAEHGKRPVGDDTPISFQSDLV